METSDRPIYMISVAAELVGMHPQTLRMYETKGLVRPQRTPGGTRLYSEADVERLRIIQRLTSELGLNLAGVELVLRLEDELRKAHAQVERLQHQLRRDSTWMTRRISSSRPMTGTSFPASAASVRTRPNLLSAWYVPSGSCEVTRWPPRTAAIFASSCARGTTSSASSRCSVDT